MYKQITSEQRYTISILLQQGMKKKDIATAIKVSPSTISRELKRNSGRKEAITGRQPRRMLSIISIVALATDLSDKTSRRGHKAAQGGAMVF